MLFKERPLHLVLVFVSPCSMKQYSSLPSEGLLINFLGLTIVGLAITVVYIVTKSEYKREPTPDEEHIQLAE